MRIGDVFGDRFELLQRAGAGGMGTVWRVLDRQTGEPAALKVLRDPDGGDASRFLHEGKLLASLQHPQIVQYVAHGVLETGDPYLVMEWLEGESLSERLGRGALGIEETLELMQLVANALAAAHAQGVVHRDIKPSNLFFGGEQVASVKVLDFGIARQSGVTGGLTRTGSILGTPGYMAPEQARGDRDISAAADVFALGCVMFECLTGQPAFQGAHPIALLAKLLFEDAPQLHEIRPDLPRSLSQVASRMMAKEPAQRLQNGAEVEVALRGVLTSSLDSNVPSIPSRAITDTERRLVSIVAVAAPEAQQTMGSATTLPVGAPQDLISAVRRAAVPLGAAVEVLANGVVIAVLVGEGNPTDQAAAAARCALWVKSSASESAVVLVTGRAEGNQRLPIGEALEQAASLLDKTGASAPIRIDGATHALLDSRFIVMEEHGRILLRDERRVGEEPRMLLGRASPFVGRDRDLRNILSMIEDAVEERRPVAVVVTGAPGMGKSRLRHELSRVIRENRTDIGFVLARPDAIGAGSAYGLVSDSLRSSLILTAGEPLAAQRDKVKLLVNVYFQGEKAQRIAEFIGELARTPFPDENSPQLRAARQNPQLMADQIQTAYIELMGAVSTSRGLLFVLEDLHWGDAPSIKLLDVALRELRDRPIAIVAFARPEVHEAFPRLWTGRDVHEIRLGPLSRRAALELVQTMLGTTLPAERATALVERAEGNAFYLEELIRSASGGADEALPETVLGMVEARLARLSPRARRLLRAASIFGETFWKGGVKTLFGDDMHFELDLQALDKDELITRRIQSRFVSEDEYAFRHALLREGAYAMLAEQDRTLGHRMAAEWLERAGELDSMILAEHFERGGGGESAAQYYLQAAEQALRGSDIRGAIDRAGRGVVCGAQGETLGALYAMQSEAQLLAAEYQHSHERALLAIANATPGSVAHCRALSTAMIATPHVNDPLAAQNLMQQLLRIEPVAAGATWIVISFVTAVYSLIMMAKRGPAEIYMRRLEELANQHEATNVLIAAWRALARGIWSRHVERDPQAALAHDRQAEAAFTLAAEHNYLPAALTYGGVDLVQLGRWEDAERNFTAALVGHHRVNLFVEMARYHRALGRLLAGKVEEAMVLARAELDKGSETQNTILSALNTFLLATACIRLGDLTMAESLMQPHGDVANSPVIFSVGRKTVFAELRLAQGNAHEATRLSSEALGIIRSCGMSMTNHEVSLPLIHALALRESGDIEGYRAALSEARTELFAQAQRVTDPEHRKQFLAVPARTRLLELAQEALDAS